MDGVFKLTKIDPWFLVQIEELVKLEEQVKERGMAGLDADFLRALKRKGFADARLAKILGVAEGEVRKLRARHNIFPVYKRVDTCAAEFATNTAYMYSSYDEECRPTPPTATRSWSSVAARTVSVRASSSTTAAYTRPGPARRRLRDHHGQLQPGDRLHRLRHLRPPLLRAGDPGRRAGNRAGRAAQGRHRPVRRPDSAETGAGIGSQRRAGHGTSPDAIDRAEDRERFQSAVERLGLKQPENGTVTALEQAVQLAAAHHLPAGGSPSLRAGWPRHGNRL